MFNRLRQTLAKLLVGNSMSLPNQYLKYGSRGRLSLPKWDQVAMTDQDVYTGYTYSAIRKRASAVARIASENVKTETNSKKTVDHPYLEAIWNSKTFTEYMFWSTISTYLDLEGVYYLMAIRGKVDEIHGRKIEFKLLNPYNIRPVRNRQSLELGGYVETRDGLIREIPANMIVDIRELNPFNDNEAYSMVDAIKESQFTLKTAGDYTRHALTGNINAPGILGTEVLMDDTDFDNFVSRIQNHEKGEPLFGNGTGAVTYTNMESKLKDAALVDVNEIQRDVLFSVADMSKTMMGIEQSGVTRDTARVQKELNIEGSILPRIQLIIDALNLDYRNKYPEDYERDGFYLLVDNPTAVDHEADVADAEAKQKKLDLYNSLIDKGYDEKIAAKYVNGEIDISGLGKPKNEPKEDPEEMDDEPVEEEPEDEPEDNNGFPVDKQAFEQEKQGLIQQQQGVLKNAIVNIEEQVALVILNRVQKKTAKNQFEDEFEKESDVITSAEKKSFINQLAANLSTFYALMMGLGGEEQMRNRMGEFAMKGTFVINAKIKATMTKLSYKVAESHIDTVAGDLYEEARNAAKEGLGQQEIISRIKSKYSDVIETRAKTIARTETNRIFTQAQFEADKQFVKQNKLEGRAYKRWVTRSGNPCQFCLALSQEKAIPFHKNFRSLGDTVEADGTKLKVNFTSLECGNAHPNCSCHYELIIL